MSKKKKPAEAEAPTVEETFEAPAEEKGEEAPVPEKPAEAAMKAPGKAGAAKIKRTDANAEVAQVSKQSPGKRKGTKVKLAKGITRIDY